MKPSGSGAIKVALYGMDARSCKTMQLYLKGPCRGIAEVVDEAVAEVDILDADFAKAGEILEQLRQKTPPRPIILLSLQVLKIENTYFVAKPVNAQQLMGVLSQLGKKHPPVAIESPEKLEPILKPIPTEAPVLVEKPRKRRSTFQDNEGGYTAFLGTLMDVDFHDPEQFIKASFDPKNYLLSYVLSALKVSSHLGVAQQLNSVWKPLLIFPGTRQIWLDADDKQLRAFAGIEQSKMFAGNISLVALDVEAASSIEQDKSKFQDVEAFIWKLALWTSKGRFPVDIDPNLPVYLKHWPNFTRLMLIPEVMRMAALLIDSPRSPLEVARVLQVKPHYVFAFITACQSLGILAQAKRQSDNLVMPEAPKPSQKQSLFSKILHKLRGE
jgi:hypothetical protein